MNSTAAYASHAESLSRFGILASALWAFCFTVAFFLPDFTYYLFYLLMLSGLTLVGQLSLIKVNRGVLRTLFSQNKWIFLGVVAWLLLVSLSFLKVWIEPSTSVRQYQMSTLRYIYDLLLLAFVFMVARCHMQGFIRIEKLIIGLALGFVVLLAVQFLYYHQFVISSQDWFSEPPFAPHIRDQGNLACVISMSFFSWWLVKKPEARSFQLMMVLAIWMGLSFIFWAGGRAAIASVAVTSLMLIGFFSAANRVNPIKAFALIGLLFILAFITAEFLSVYPWNGIARSVADAAQIKAAAAQTAGVQSISTESVDLNRLTTGRMNMWMMSLKAFWAEPWLGLGPYGYFFIPERVYDDQPHNFIIQFLVEWGVLGAACMFALMLASFVFVLKRLPEAFKNQKVSFIMASTIICVLTLHGLTGGTYFKIQPLTFLSIAYAVVLGEYLRSAVKAREAQGK